MGSLIDQAWNVVSESRNQDGEVDIINDLINEIERLQARVEALEDKLASSTELTPDVIAKLW